LLLRPIKRLFESFNVLHFIFAGASLAPRHLEPKGQVGSKKDVGRQQPPLRDLFVWHFQSKRVLLVVPISLPYMHQAILLTTFTIAFLRSRTILHFFTGNQL
jgi:hypothetical protein